MLQKLFGNIFGSSEPTDHTDAPQNEVKGDTDTNASAASGSASEHGIPRARGHKPHTHLCVQRGLKPYHNSGMSSAAHLGVTQGSASGSSSRATQGHGAAPSPHPKAASGANPTTSSQDTPRCGSSTSLDGYARTPAAVAGSSLSSVSHARSPSQRALKTEVYFRDEAPFLAAMAKDSVDVVALRSLSWHGCPVPLRSDVWMLLSGHWHPVKGLRDGVVARKRQEYTSYVQGNYNLVDWDAVCALADRGKDGASVRRSALLSQHPQRRGKGLPARNPKPQTHTSHPQGSLSPPDARVAPARSQAGTPLLMPMRARSSHSTLDLLALEDQRPQRDPDRAFTDQHKRPPSPEDEGPGDSGLERRDSRSSNRGGGGRRASQDVAESNTLVKDMSICSAPAVLTEASNSLYLDGLTTPGRRYADPTTSETVSRPITPPFVASDSRSGFGAQASAADNPPARTHGTHASGAATTAEAFSFPTASPGHVSSSGRGPVPRRVSSAPRVSVSTMVSSHELLILKQIRKDVPRMSGGAAYLQHPRVQGMIERLLFTWSLRHPACGYVQGMNDLLAPFVSVSLARRFCPTRSISELRAYDRETVSALWSEEAVPAAVWIGELEADIYWCASYFLNGMQDNYTQNQTGLYQMCERLRQVINAADVKLYTHLVDTLQLNFVQFTFRWMNCMLMRELTEAQRLRLMDAYLSDQDRRWSVTHVYVCAALLLRWSKPLLGMTQFLDAASFLQSPPTASMTPREMDDVLSEAFVLENLYDAGLQHRQT